jgi:hypothetical protein
VATNPNASANAPPFVLRSFVSFVVATRAHELRLRERVAKANQLEPVKAYEKEYGLPTTTGNLNRIWVMIGHRVTS